PLLGVIRPANKPAIRTETTDGHSRHCAAARVTNGVLDDGFRVVEEILGKHPPQVVGLHPGDRSKWLPAVLAESESNFASDADKVADRIDSVRVFHVLVQAGNRARQVWHRLLKPLVLFLYLGAL